MEEKERKDGNFDRRRLPSCWAEGGGGGFTDVSHTRPINSSVQPSLPLARFVYGGPNSGTELGTHEACTTMIVINWQASR